MFDRRRAAYLEVMKLLASKLGPLRNKVVLVGGMVAGLLITDLSGADVRATDDIDLVIEATTYSDYTHVQDQLRDLGFQNVQEGPSCRFRIGALVVDIMPTNGTYLGFNSAWYPEIMENFDKLDLGDGIELKTVTAPLFLCTKFDAFNDRGSHDFMASEDIEDIVGVIEGRVELFREITHSANDVRDYLKSQFLLLLESNAFFDALPGALRSQTKEREALFSSRLKLLVAYAANRHWSLLEHPADLFSAHEFAYRGPERPRRLTRKQHELIAPAMRVLSNRFTVIQVELSNTYPNSSPLIKACDRAGREFGRFKSAMDDEFYRALKVDEPSPYYGSKGSDVPLAEFLDDEIRIIAAEMRLLGEDLRQYYPVAGTKVGRSWEKLANALDLLEHELLQGHAPRQRKRAYYEAKMSDQAKTAVIAAAGALKQTQTQKQKGDFLGHECEWCRPLEEKNGIPVLPAYAEAPSRIGRRYQLNVWCKYCWKFHLHGADKDGYPVDETITTHRSAHCHYHDVLGWYENGYYIRCIGLLTDEIVKAHRPFLPTRGKHIRQLKEETRRKRSEAYLHGDRALCGVCVESDDEDRTWVASAVRGGRGRYLANCSRCNGLINVTRLELNLLEPDET